MPSWIYHLLCNSIKLDPAVCKQTKSTCFRKGKKAGRKIRSQLSGTPYQYPIQREKPFIIIWKARWGMGKGGQQFPVTLQSWSHITPASAAGRNAGLTRAPAKVHPWKQQPAEACFPASFPSCWLNNFQCFYHHSASRVHSSLMTVWKLTEKRNFNWELNLGLSFVGSLMHRLSSYCIL